MVMDILQSIYEIVLSESNKNHTRDVLLDINRTVLEPYVYQYLMELYGPMLRSHWETYIPPKKSDHVFVIVERRVHPNFRFILQNIAWAAPYMAVYIFCSNENQEFVEALLGSKKDHYHIIPVFTGNPSREEGKHVYNNLLTDYRFYQLIDASYMLTVQMDNIFRKKIDPQMFIGEYWGNPWNWKQDAAGGGGATVRNISAMIRICTTYRNNPDMLFNEIEDDWLSNHVIDYPSLAFRSEHIMESTRVHDPHILHQFWTFLDSYLHLPRDGFIEFVQHLLTIV